MVFNGTVTVTVNGLPSYVMLQGEEKQNVAEMAIARGFATVIKHRTDEERSCVYEK